MTTVITVNNGAKPELKSTMKWYSNVEREHLLPITRIWAVIRMSVVPLDWRLNSIIQDLKKSNQEDPKLNA